MPRDPMLDAPRLLDAREYEPLYPRELPPNAPESPPELREKSRPPMLSAPPADLAAPPTLLDDLLP